MIVFVCSPFHGFTTDDIESNVGRARIICRALVLADHLPIAPHLYFPQFMDDKVAAERDTGIARGHQLMRLCRAVVKWWPSDTEIGGGMESDLQRAAELDLPVLHLRLFAALHMEGDSVKLLINEGIIGEFRRAEGIE